MDGEKCLCLNKEIEESCIGGYIRQREKFPLSEESLNKVLRLNVFPLEALFFSTARTAVSL
jgi:hypothetical protein